MDIQHTSTTYQQHSNSPLPDSILCDRGRAEGTSILASMNYVPNEDRVFVLNNIREATPLVIILQVVDSSVGHQRVVTLYPVTGTPTLMTPPTITTPKEESK